MERPVAYSFHVPLNTDMLVAEVAGGTFAFKNQVKSGAVKLLWEKLGFLVAETLKQQKGVLLPSLGNFRVGPVVGESNSKIRPSFRLLEGRYGAISQEQPKYIVGGKAPIVQPNYGLLSSSAKVHRGVGQRLVAELLNRLGVHILSERPIKVELPCVGKLQSSRTGRIEFVFDPLLLDFFVSQREMVVREMDYSADDYEVQKGLQQVTLEDPPLIKSPRRASRPVSAVSAVSKGVRMPRNPKGLYTQGLRVVLQLCNTADRIGSGCVSRERLQTWLTQECRPVLSLLDGGSLMDLLDRHTYGKKVQQILYRQFLYALDDALGAAGASPRDRVPSPAPSPRPTGEGISSQPGPGEGSVPVVSVVPSPRVNGWTGEASPPIPQGPEPEEYAHYVQNQLSPRSRADYDAFNRIHFERLHSARGVLRKQEVKRAVTPKVGEEPLNIQEYQAVRSVSPMGARGRAQTPLWPSQQQQQQQQRWAATANAFGLLPRAPPRPYVHPHSPEVLQLLQPSGPSYTPSPQQQQQQQQQAYSAPPHLQQPRLQQGQQAQQEQQGQRSLQGQGGLYPGGYLQPARQPAEWQVREREQERGQPYDILAPPAASPALSNGPTPEWQQREQQQERGAPYNILAPSYVPPASAIASASLSEWQQRERQQERGAPYNILAPPPAPSAPRDKGEQPLSQYDIARELDRDVKAKLKAEYAAQLQEGWGKQIREKEELHGVLQEQEQRWPYGPVGVPMDKRPVSAISRPYSPRRSPRGAGPAGGH